MCGKMKLQHLPSMIIFFGPDGVGKTTQANLLVKHLYGRKVARIWIRGGHSLAFILSNFLVMLGYYRTVKVPSGVIYKIFDPQLLPKLKPLWGFIEFISVLPWIILKACLPRFFGYTIVADRYVVDTVVYLGYWLGHGFFRSYLAKILLSFIPKDSVIIHLDADLQALIGRLHYDTATKNFLIFQRKAYGIYATSLYAKTICTSQNSVEETHRKIVETLKNAKPS